MDSEKMKNIMPGSLEEFQFLLTLKQEEDVSQNELHCPCRKGSPQPAWYMCERKPRYKLVPGGARSRRHGLLGQSLVFQVSEKLDAVSSQQQQDMRGHQMSRLGKKANQNNNKKAQNKTYTTPTPHVNSPQSASGHLGKWSGVGLIQYTLCTGLVYNLKITTTRPYLGKPVAKIIQEVFSMASQEFSHVLMLFNTACYGVSPRKLWIWAISN